MLLATLIYASRNIRQERCYKAFTRQRLLSIQVTALNWTPGLEDQDKVIWKLDCLPHFHFMSSWITDTSDAIAIPACLRNSKHLLHVYFYFLQDNPSGSI